MINEISIFKYMNKSQTALRWSIALILTVTISLAFAIINLSNQITTSEKILTALSPYIMTQVEVNDRIEINRILGSVTKNGDSKLVLIKDGKVFSTTDFSQEIELPFVAPTVKFQFLGGLFTKNEIIVTTTLKRNSSSSESKLYFYTPMGPIVRNTLTIMAITFLSSIIISLLVSWKTKRALKKALNPLEQLHDEIRNLKSNTSNISSPIRIKELEDFRQTIINTRTELIAANEKIATQKAKELNAESYKRLIHDLHNPVAALRQMVRLQTFSEIDEEGKKEALESIPVIAEEILQQVTAAKKNLENDSIDFEEVDLRNCIRESYYQVRATFKDHQDKIILNLPETAVIRRHDPAMLKRAIVNLLENGLEASKNTVELQPELKLINAINFSVSKPLASCSNLKLKNEVIKISRRPKKSAAFSYLSF